MEKPAFSVAENAIAPMIAVHGKTESAVKGSASFDIVAWNDRDDAVARLFRHEWAPFQTPKLKLGHYLAIAFSGRQLSINDVPAKTLLLKTRPTQTSDSSTVKEAGCRRSDSSWIAHRRRSVSSSVCRTVIPTVSIGSPVVSVNSPG